MAVISPGIHPTENIFRYLWNSNNALNCIRIYALWLGSYDICFRKSLVSDFYINRSNRYGEHDALGIATSNRKSIQEMDSKIHFIFSITRVFSIKLG